MKTVLVCAVHILFIFICIASCLADSSPKQPKRSKGSYAIMPVMRVGRRSMPFYPQKKGEPLLTPFMRTGRGDSAENLLSLAEEDNGAKKRTGSGNNGLWFGPRLGRVQKRAEYNPWTYIILDEPPKTDDYYNNNNNINNNQADLLDDFNA